MIVNKPKLLRRKVHLTEAQRYHLKQLSAESGQSVAALVRQAIDFYLAQVESSEDAQKEITEDADTQKPN